VHIQIALFDGFDPLDALGPYEVLWAASLFTEEPVSVELASVDGPRSVPSGSGLFLDTNAQLNPAVADVIVVPGAAGRVGGEDEETAEGTIPVLLSRTLATGLPEVLRTALGSERTTVACVCGGTLIPAMAGLIEGRPAVTHHLGMDLLDATGVRAIKARIVDDGNLISAGGVTSGLDLGLYVVERFIGPRIAHAVEDLFEFERRGVVWTSRGPEACAL
jgi:transcriptional regulator GlxA family with amidase domain